MTWQEVQRDAVTITASVVASIVATLAFKDMEFSFRNLLLVSLGSLVVCAAALLVLNHFMRHRTFEERYKRSNEEKM